MFTYTWSDPSAIGSINSGDSINYNIFVDKEYTDEITMLPVVERMGDLRFEQIIETEDDLLPKNISISINDMNVIISGNVNAPAPFVELAFSVQGDPRYVSSVDDIPKGSKVFKAIPDSSEYKYFRWKVYTYDQAFEESILVERIFTLQVRVSWEQAKQTILRLAREIE